MHCLMGNWVLICLGLQWSLRPTSQLDLSMHDEKVEVEPLPEAGASHSALPAATNFNFNSIPKLEVSSSRCAAIINSSAGSV